MFDALSERIGNILDGLTRRGALTEADVDQVLAATDEAFAQVAKRFS